jgi:hypothetical protein
MSDHLCKKAGLLGSAVGLVVGTMALSARATNLLINPGFESPDDLAPPDGHVDSMVTGWTFYGSAVRANYQNNTPSGEWSIWEQTFMPSGGISQTVGNITVGANYTLSGNYYFEQNEPTVGGEVSDVALSFLNASGVVINQDVNGLTYETDIPATSVTTTGAWIQYSVSGVAPTGATQVIASFDFTNGFTVSGPQAAFVDDADLEGPGIPPAVLQWVVNGDGSWNRLANWNNGLIPNAPGAEADFFGAISSSPRTVFTDSAITVGTLHFNNANEYVIAGAPTLTLQTASGSALVQVDQGTDDLDLPITVASNTVFNVASGATLIVANPLTINSGKSLTQSGGGTVTYQSLINVLSGGSISFGNSTHAHELSIAAGSKASVGGTGAVLTLDSLANGGTVDLQGNTMVIDYGSSTDPIATIRAELIAGRNGGTWNGTSGINSSIAALGGNSNRFALGYADGADGVVSGLASGQIEIKYTLLGDANLDGVVNGVDFTLLAANLGREASSWDRGDFLYTGAVSGQDFTALVGNLGKQANGASVVLGSADLAAIDAFAVANGLLADVPEPASGAMLVVGAAILGRRRRTK